MTYEMVIRTSERQKAIANKSTKYLGSPCSKNHNGWRWTGSGNCMECVKLKYVPTGRKKGKQSDPARTAAREKGELYYYSGRPCLRGHMSKRRVTTGSCQECHKKFNNSKKHSLKAKYKITLEQYNEMLKLQNGVCKICNKPETAIDKVTKKIRTLSVDHCHDTKKVRGLLCHNCNVGIGSLKHNPNFLRTAALYCETVND
jgi:hypothetical protein